MTLAQIEAIESISKIESISVIGLLLLIIVGLAWYIKRLLNENKELQGHIMGFVEKYYTMSTKIYEFMERLKKDV